MTTQMTEATELLNSRIFWVTKPDATGLVKVVTTRAFDSTGNRSIDWRTLDGLKVSSRMHFTQADERLARHPEYRKGTAAEMATIRAAAAAAKAQREFDALNPPATVRQMDYLAVLGVEIPAGKKLTKSEASIIIEAAKGGESLGSFGMFYQDGSN